ncbi:MAG: RNA methyltransferase [Fibrobacter sp.]|nr:RNA methyltransferase [Fibrobacter sp.]
MAKSLRTNPRWVAWKSLCQWQEKGWLQDHLARNSTQLSAADRAFAWNLALGVCRNHLRLAATVAEYSRKAPKLSVQLALELGIWQLQEQSRVPTHAAIFETVNLIKSQFGAKVGSFGNAMLRRVQRQGWAMLPQDPVKRLSLEYSVQGWLVRHWLKNLNYEQVDAKLRAARSIPRQWLRYQPAKISAEDLRQQLNLPEARFWGERWLEVGTELAQVLRSEAFAQGLVSVQNPAADLVVQLLDLQPNQRVWDACAAPGGKSALILEREPTARLWATDVNPRRLQDLQDLEQRLGLSSFKTHVCDLSQESLAEEFDSILVDAPCSNLGVMSRRPELPLRLRPEDFKALPVLQLQILSNAARALKVGGVLVYATCSPEREESTAVIEKFLAQNPNFRLENAAEFVDDVWVKNSMILIEPNELGLDEFFAAKLRRVK